jgi:hypothetical protein
MRTFALTTALVASFIIVSACKKDDPPPTTPTATATGYPPGYPPPTGYPPTGTYPTATQPVPQPTAPMPTAPSTATMSVPGPLAFPCQNDAACGLHHCNMQYQKCTFPCANADVDCVPGNSCLGGLCVPKPPGQ